MGYPDYDATNLRHTITQVDAALDENVSPIYKEQPLAQDWARVAKAKEEKGEAIAALIGWTGQNPRKGYTHNLDDLLSELADWALTGMYAIQHFTKDSGKTWRIIEERANIHYSRLVPGGLAYNHEGESNEQST